jgi:hypothetical protein
VRERRDLTGNPRTPAESLSVTGGWGWVEVESVGSLCRQWSRLGSAMVGRTGFSYLTVQVVGGFSFFRASPEGVLF